MVSVAIICIVGVLAYGTVVNIHERGHDARAALAAAKQRSVRLTEIAFLAYSGSWPGPARRLDLTERKPLHRLLVRTQCRPADQYAAFL
jgi:hypothetical protein